MKAMKSKHGKVQTKAIESRAHTNDGIQMVVSDNHPIPDPEINRC